MKKMKNVSFFKAVFVVTLLMTLGTFCERAEAFSKDSLVWQKCTDCHEPSKGKISAVEEIRTTPEEWTVIVERMARLHGMELTGEEMKALVKELCTTQGLSAEEQEKVAYLNLTNNTQFMETPVGANEEKLFTTCVRCHSGGKIYSYRMTESAWAKLTEFHLYMFPSTVFQMREMRFVPEANAVLAQLAKDYPYGQSPEVAKDSPAGSWIIMGREPGKGDYRGEATIVTNGDDEYTLKGTLNFADGTTESFNGGATLYGGHALRTYSDHNGYATLGAYSFVDGVIRGEHHYPAPDYRTSASTWYPVGGEAAVLKVSPGYLLSGETTTLILEGHNLPKVKKSDIKFADGSVKVLKVENAGPQTLAVQVLYKGKKITTSGLKVKGIDAGTVTLATQVDYIAVTPEMGRARLDGGRNYPAEGVQFEAVAYSKGANADDSADDLLLGPVHAEFKLSEEVTRDEDDDLAWVGAIAENGRFSPTGDYGSVTTREYETEASGMVKVEAEYHRGDRVYKASARLAVVPPDYIKRIK